MSTTSAGTVNVDRLVESLRPAGERGLTACEITAKTGLTLIEIQTACFHAQKNRIETNDRPGSGYHKPTTRLWLSIYEREGMHPNAGEVMAWLSRPLPRKYIENHRPEMKAALAELVKRRLVKSTGTPAVCYRADRPAHEDRAARLSKTWRALDALDPDDRSQLGDMLDAMVT